MRTNNNVLKVTTPSSTYQPGAEAVLLVSPNPADAQFSFYSPEAAELRIFNTVGGLLSVRQVGAGLQQISTAELPSGVYLVRLEVGGAVQSGKVVVSH